MKTAALPSPTRRFWHAMPLRSYLLFLGGVFCLFSTFGFINDFDSTAPWSPPWLAVDVLLAGLAAVAWAMTATKSRKFAALAVPLHLAAILGPDWRDSLPPQVVAPGAAETRQRAEISSVGAIVGILLGYASLVVFVATEGRRYMRLQAEISLAQKLHQTIAPPIDSQVDRFAFFGASMPSSEVGGDLIDVIVVDDRWTACVADVSGHGVASGTLMAMFKSAARSQLMLKRDPDAVLTDVNQIVFDLKTSSMFITCALLASCSDTTLQFTLAGHFPIFRVRGDGASLDELSVAHLPLGMFEGHTYRSLMVDCQPGDLFVLVTDGLVEVFDPSDEEFGLERLKTAIRANAAKPLPEAFQAIVDAVRRHGPQADDQSLLLVRCLPPRAGSAAGVAKHPA